MNLHLISDLCAKRFRFPIDMIVCHYPNRCNKLH